MVVMFVYFFFFKQKTAYEMRISDWSSDVCSSDLLGHRILDQLRLHLGGDGGRIDIFAGRFILRGRRAGGYRTAQDGNDGEALQELVHEALLADDFEKAKDE